MHDKETRLALDRILENHKPDRSSNLSMLKSHLLKSEIVRCLVIVKY